MEKNNQIITYFLSKPRLLLLLSGVLPIVFALTSQYGFGLYPCELCIYQRIPFTVVAIIAIFSFALKNNQTLFKAILGLSILAFLINTGIAFFHVGVEQKWWIFGECSADLDMSSIEALKKALFEAPTVRCDDVQFRLLGLSMAGWNVIYSMVAALFFFRIYKKV